MLYKFKQKIHNCEMDAKAIKNAVNMKRQRINRIILMLISLIALFNSYCFGQNVNNQQNQQNININLPVIEKTVYVDKYRTVYVDKPQPKRVAKRLSTPIQLLGFLWVFPEDLGNFKQQPLGIIESINSQNMYERDNWRIPTPDELAVLEANADKVGLGDEIYLATDHSNGVLRLVSTGKTRMQLRQEMIKSGKVVEIQGTYWSKEFELCGWICGCKDKIGEISNSSEMEYRIPDGWRLPTINEVITYMQSKGLKEEEIYNMSGRTENSFYYDNYGKLSIVGYNKNNYALWNNIANSYNPNGRCYAYLLLVLK